MTAEQGLEGGGISTGLWGGGRGIARPQVGAPMLRERESGGGRGQQRKSRLESGDPEALDSCEAIGFHSNSLQVPRLLCGESILGGKSLSGKTDTEAPSSHAGRKRWWWERWKECEVRT